MSLRILRLSLSLAVATLFAAPALAIEVKSTATASAAVSTEQVLQPLSTSFYSAGIGVAASRSMLGFQYWGAFTVLKGSSYFSLRAALLNTVFTPKSGSDPRCTDDCYSNINEQALIIGHQIAPGSRVWLGTGIARVQRRNGEGPAPSFITAGLPLEIAFLVPRSTPFHGDFRITANINGKQNYLGFLAAFRFGG